MEGLLKVGLRALIKTLEERQNERQLTNIESRKGSCTEPEPEPERKPENTLTMDNIYTYKSEDDIEKIHGVAHTDAWEAEELIKIAQLKKSNLIILKEDIDRIDADIANCKIQIDHLSNEILKCSAKIINIEPIHGEAHTFEYTMQAVSDLNILEDLLPVNELVDKSFNFMHKIHNGHHTLIIDCYKKRLERLQLEMDLKKMLVNIDGLQVLVRNAEKEVADDTICEREKEYTKIELEKTRIHYLHEKIEFVNVYDDIKNDTQATLVDNIKKYEKFVDNYESKHKT